VQHETQIAGFRDSRRLGFHIANQPEGGGEFPAAQIGLIHALPFAGTALEHFLKLHRRVVRRGTRQHFQISMDAVGDIAQKQAGALLAIILDVLRQLAGSALHRGFHVAAGHHARDLVASQIDPAYRLEHFDPADMPADRRLPQDSLEAGSRGGRGHHVIADPLDFHLRAGETGVRAG